MIHDAGVLRKGAHIAVARRIAAGDAARWVRVSVKAMHHAAFLHKAIRDRATDAIGRTEHGHAFACQIHFHVRIMRATRRRARVDSAASRSAVRPQPKDRACVLFGGVLPAAAAWLWQPRFPASQLDEVPGLVIEIVSQQETPTLCLRLMFATSRISITTACALVVALIVPHAVLAAERRFTYSYETTTAPKGAWELEQWFTWKGANDEDAFTFRHELEYGLSDSLQLGFYLSDWQLTRPHNGGSETEWSSAGAEVIYSMSYPTKDSVGSALYGEFKIGPEVFAFESKLLLQKNFGPLTLVYNFVLEAEWEGDHYEEDVGVIENTVGLSYQFTPGLFLGAEAMHEVEFEGWQDAGPHVVGAGPNISFRKGSFFATVTGLFQFSNVDDEPDHQIRLIAGFHF